MSARSSSDSLPQHEEALLGHEKYHELGAARRRSGFWTRCWRQVVGLKWLIVLGTQALLLYQVRQLLLLRHLPVRNGDEINGFAPRLSTEIVHPINEMDFYISNYTSDEDMATLRHRWVDLLPRQFYVMTEYDRIVRHGPNGQERVIPPGFHSVHTRHCFEILRQSILCHLDMTLEGSMPGGPPSGTTGFGHAHVCQNRRESMDWMAANRGFDETLIIKEG
ncbi:hypothetical protein PG984_011303 [Apiospora sp. TS-2023a]